MNDWMSNPILKQMKPEKLKLIQDAARAASGQTGKNLATIMMSLITTANQKKIHFNDDEIALILELLKDGKSEKEQAQIDKTIRLTRSLLSKYHFNGGTGEFR